MRKGDVQFGGAKGARGCFTNSTEEIETRNIISTIQLVVRERWGQRESGVTGGLQKRKR